MKIVQIKDKKHYNNFVGAQKHSQFLQSWEWGEFQFKVSGPIWRLGVENDNNELIAAATIIKKELPMGKSYFYCPRGPIVNYQLSMINDQLILEKLFNEIRNIAKDEGIMFLRFEPLTDIQHSKIDIRQSLDVQPSKTLILNLSKTEDDILKNMHQKTRYNIRLAKKKRVKIIEGDINNFDSFWRLLNETTGRDSFRSHGQDYYAEMLKIDSDFIKLYIAEHNGKAIAANVVSFFGDTVAYLHGASSNEYRNIMAPYLLQWYVIRQAKESGYKYYDLHGFDEKKWPGVTRFKKGFVRLDSPASPNQGEARQGGNEINYPGTFDLVFNLSWYSVYKMVRKVRRTF